MKYDIVQSPISGDIVKRTDTDGSVWWIPIDETNSDYQQYLIDTDGGLPIPETPASQ